MTIQDWWCRLKSYLSDRPIAAGYGFTNDNNVVLSHELSQVQLEKPISELGAKCSLKPDIGRWEVVSFVRKGRDTFIEVRHILSGEKMTVSKAVYTLIFRNAMIGKS